jgi:hypothetical protein
MNNDQDDEGVEVGFLGQTVTLTGTDYLGNEVSLETVTDEFGNYAFTDVLDSNPDGYTITHVCGDLEEYEQSEP